jgi:hypothetical protein
VFPAQSWKSVREGTRGTRFTPQLIGISLVLLIFRGARDFDRFVVTFLCAAVLAEAASVVVPTLGPMAALAKDTAFVNVPSIGRGTADIMIDLREGTAIALVAIASGYYIENWLNQLIAFFCKFPQRGRRRIDVDLREISSIVPE